MSKIQIKQLKNKDYLEHFKKIPKRKSIIFKKKNKNQKKKKIKS